MTGHADARIEQLEATTGDLASRVATLERTLGYPSAAPRVDPAPVPTEAPAPAPVTPRPATYAPRRPAPAPSRRARPSRGVEDLFGGRVLAWIGGVAVLVGIALFFALAVSNGWIGETARVVLAGIGSAALLSVGVWLRERKSQAEAALAAAGTGVAGLFMTLTVAAEVYGVIGAIPAFLGAAGVGTVAMVIAVRWRSQLIAALGIVGSLVAPLTVGAPSTATTVALLFTVTAAAAAVLVWQRWEWLAVATFCIATPQWVAWLFETGSAVGIVATLVAFGAAGMLAAIGFELRLPYARLRGTSSALFALNAVVLAAAGYLALDHAGQAPLGRTWLACLAATYVAVGITASRSKRISHDLQLLVLALGVLLGDIAFAALVSGPLLALGWAGSSILFAALVRSRREIPADALLAQLGLGGHLALAIGHALVSDASPATVGGTPDATALLVTAAIAASCFISARVADARPDVRVVLDLVGAAFVAYLTALAIDGPSLVVSWAAEAVVLAQIARTRRDGAAVAAMAGFLSLAAGHLIAFESPLRDVFAGDAVSTLALGATAALTAAALVSARLLRREWPQAGQALDAMAAVSAAYLAAAALDGAAVSAAWGGTGLLLALMATRVCSRDLVLGAAGYASLALTHALAFEAPPEAFLYGADDLAVAVVALAASACAPLALARLRWLDRHSRVVVAAVGGLTLLYLASVAVVTVLEGGAHAVGDLGVEEQGQMAASGLWALAGVCALVVGLGRDVRELRVGALVLLLATTAKVFVFDLAALTSIYRVVSFVALGLLLLVGSFAYQRLRPRAVARDEEEALAC